MASPQHGLEHDGLSPESALRPTDGADAPPDLPRVDPETQAFDAFCERYARALGNLYDHVAPVRAGK